MEEVGKAYCYCVHFSKGLASTGKHVREQTKQVMLQMSGCEPKTLDYCMGKAFWAADEDSVYRGQ